MLIINYVTYKTLDYAIMYFDLIHVAEQVIGFFLGT
jgi:hypothetical protein